VEKNNDYSTALKNCYWKSGCLVSFFIISELFYYVFHHEQNNYASIFPLFRAVWGYEFLTTDYRFLFKQTWVELRFQEALKLRHCIQSPTLSSLQVSYLMGI